MVASARLLEALPSHLRRPSRRSDNRYRTMKSQKPRPLLWSLIGGAGLVVGTALIGLRESLSGINVLALPGLCVAALLYRQGVHSGSDGSAYVALATLINFVAYSLFSYLVIRIGLRIRSRTTERNPRPVPA